jgi:hypothetical protein
MQTIQKSQRTIVRAGTNGKDLKSHDLPKAPRLARQKDFQEFSNNQEKSQNRSQNRS